MQIMNATEEDKDELLALYHAMIGGPCEWSTRMRTRSHLTLRMKTCL